MNVVDFSEGILGIGDAKDEVAICLRAASINEGEDISYLMNHVADNLEAGKRTNIVILRAIGEKPLADTQRLFLDSCQEKK